MFRQILGLILITALAVLIIPASANNLMVGNAVVDVIGNSASVPIILEEAPNGLSGYNITVSLSDPQVGEIIGVTYPAWNTMNDNSSLPADSAWLKAYDGANSTYGNVSPGAANILLATLTIRGDAGGVTAVNVVPNQIDEDGPGLITPAVVPGSFTVNTPVSPPVAAFIADPLSGNAPLLVQFTDNSVGTGLSRAWDFNNDGTIDSTVQDPLYSYASTGTYSVNLTVTNTAGRDSEVKTGYIFVNVAPPSPPVANFARSPQSGPAPVEVHFTDTSAGGTPTSWAWDFEDDGTIDNTTQNPVFVYNTPGTYTTNLTVANAGGSSSTQKSVNVTEPQKPSTIGIFRNSTHIFCLDINGNGVWNGAPADKSCNFGATGDIPVSGDWNKNYISKIGVFRPSTHMFYLDINGNGIWNGAVADKVYNFGAIGDIPVSGDWDNDGLTEIGVFRPSTHMFYLDVNGNGVWNGAPVDKSYNFGAIGDIPVSGDWDNDGLTEIGVFRPSTHMFYLDVNGNGVWNGAPVDKSYNFGAIGDKPVSGDWDNDGLTEIGVFRPSTHMFYLDMNGNGVWNGAPADKSYNFGTTGDSPIAGAWS